MLLGSHELMSILESVKLEVLITPTTVGHDEPVKH